MLVADVAQCEAIFTKAKANPSSTQYNVKRYATDFIEAYRQLFTSIQTQTWNDNIVKRKRQKNPIFSQLFVFMLNITQVFEQNALLYFVVTV